MSEENKNESPKVDIFAEKRKKALEILGKKWIMHPEYVLDPKHRVETSHIGNFNKETKRWISK